MDAAGGLCFDEDKTTRATDTARSTFLSRHCPGAAQNLPGKIYFTARGGALTFLTFLASKPHPRQTTNRTPEETLSPFAAEPATTLEIKQFLPASSGN
jgi:hypothetical protein